MNRLRDLLDAPSIALPDEIDDQVWQNDIGKRVRLEAANAMCFWMGDVQEISKLTLLPEICVLPFDNCWFEADLQHETESMVMGLLTARKADHTMLYGFVRVRQDWKFVQAMQMECFNGKPLRWSKPGGSTFACMNFIRRYVGQFLSALHCVNVSRQCHLPSEKLQKARAKRGKAPLFSYWTLQLGPKNERGEALGGTHASPRVHLRRGHPRQYAPGKYTWVQPHAVGHRELGMVHKDYSAGPGFAP